MNISLSSFIYLIMKNQTVVMLLNHYLYFHYMYCQSRILMLHLRNRIHHQHQDQLLLYLDHQKLPIVAVIVISYYFDLYYIDDCQKFTASMKLMMMLRLLHCHNHSYNSLIDILHLHYSELMCHSYYSHYLFRYYMRKHYNLPHTRNHIRNYFSSRHQYLLQHSNRYFYQYLGLLPHFIGKQHKFIIIDKCYSAHTKSFFHLSHFHRLISQFIQFLFFHQLMISIINSFSFLPLKVFSVQLSQF